MNNRNGDKAGGHALVIGGSMAGLFAARALSDHFERVTLLERDRFSDGPEPRRGAPQATHVHVFLMKGRTVAEELFPGMGEELLSAGAEYVDAAQDTEWLTPAGFAPRFRSDLPFLACSRGLLEWTVRGRVAALKEVRSVERVEVEGLLPGTGDREVAGVKVRFRGRPPLPVEEIQAKLVVDASGRNSNAPAWLEALGYEPPEESLVNSRPSYATRLYERPDDPARDWKGVYVQSAPRGHARGGVLLPIEGNRWIVSLIGRGSDYAPTDEAGFMEFARSLRTPILYEAIKDARPVSGIKGYRIGANKRRHYEKLSRQPDNFLVTGDAACAFNPVYGQGMTTAALGAVALAESLHEQSHGKDEGVLSRRFQKELARVNGAPWLLATGQDLLVPGVEGGEPGFSSRLTHRYVEGVVALSLRDISVRRTFLEVFQMLKPPTALFHPSIVTKVLRQTIKQRTSRRVEKRDAPSKTLKAA